MKMEMSFTNKIMWIEISMVPNLRENQRRADIYDGLGDIAQSAFRKLWYETVSGIGYLCLLIQMRKLNI